MNKMYRQAVIRDKLASGIRKKDILKMIDCSKQTFYDDCKHIEQLTGISNTDKILYNKIRLLRELGLTTSQIKRRLNCSAYYIKNMGEWDLDKNVYITIHIGVVCYDVSGGIVPTGIYYVSRHNDEMLKLTSDNGCYVVLAVELFNADIIDVYPSISGIVNE